MQRCYGCYGRSIVPGAVIVMSQCYGRYYFTEYARTWAGHLATPWQCKFTAITGCQSINNLLDFNTICCIFLLNNSIHIIRRNCRWGTVFVLLNKCSGLQSSVTLSSWWHCWRVMRAGVNNSLLNRLSYYFKAPLLLFLTHIFVLDKRYTLWLCDTVRQTSRGKSA